MYWQKIGKVFDPIRHRLAHGCIEFAQAPQVLVFSDFYRVYFSTRYLEPGIGKFLSRIAFVDMSKDFKTSLQVSQHEIISLGKLGAYDEHGIFPLHVMRAGDQVYGFISGVNRRVSVPADGAIGLSRSFDQGFTFQRIADGPVVAPSLKEPCINVDPSVIVHQNIFHMWYVYGVEWKELGDNVSPSRVYKIGHATAIDPLVWRKEEAMQIIPDILDKDECQAMPSVIEIDNIFHMFFCFRYASDFRANPIRGYRLGHAYSYDLSHWIRDDDAIPVRGEQEDWDKRMQCYPHVFKDGDSVFMVYNGNEFGKHGFGVCRLVLE
jgi:hypothetical protein